MVVSPELAGAAETGLDLVDDEQDPVPVGTLAQTVEEGPVSGYVAAFAEDRLDEERGGVGRSALGLQGVVELAQRELGRLLLRPAEVGRVGEGETTTPGISGLNPARNLVPEVVIEAAATVRPWKPPWKTMMLGRPVAWRARRTAASAASEPELAKKRLSRPSGSTDPSLSTRSRSGRCLTVVYCPWISLAIWRCVASTTFG